MPLWCGEIITALAMYNDIELNIAMPYEEQSTNWVEEHRDRFFKLHAESDNVAIVSHMPHTPRWEEAGEFIGREILYRSICQWCGKQGKTAYSEHGGIPNQTPFVQGICQCHPSGMPNMPHSPRWEK